MQMQSSIPISIYGGCLKKYYIYGNYYVNHQALPQVSISKRIQVCHNLETSRTEERTEQPSKDTTQGENIQNKQSVETIYQQCLDVYKEGDKLQEESAQLRLDIADITELNTEAEEIARSTGAMSALDFTYIDTLTKEIEEANVEAMLLELSRFEMERESGEIEAKREAEESKFREKMEKINREIAELKKELSGTKELERELTTINLELTALQNEMESIKSIANTFQKNLTMEDLDRISLLQSAKTELEEAKKELACLKDEGFKLMAAMDSVRGESTQIVKDSEQFESLAKDANNTIQSLNSQLYKAMSNLESTSLGEKRADAIGSTLSIALEQLNADKASAKRETEITNEEMKAGREEMMIQNMEQLSLENKLQDVMRELEQVK